jgi:hypothetical protein
MTSRIAGRCRSDVRLKDLPRRKAGTPVLMAHPTMLRHLVRNYETARALHARQGSKETQRRLEDATYTLCVSTGTRTAEDALVAAGRQLAAAQPPTTAPDGLASAV